MKRRQFLTSAAVGTAATTLATPMLAQSRIDMNIVSTWPRDFPGLGTSAQRLAARIEELTEGRIAVTYYAAGEKVGAFDAFDDVASGNSQAYIGADYYWKGKHAGWSPFTAIPMGLTYTEMDAWMKFGGGQELYEKLGDEFGVIGYPAGNTGVQMGGWFNKEIESPEDIRGLKMRIPGLGGDVISKLGGSPVSLPGGQIYENLVSGAIDATEWVGPWNDYFLKLYEAAKYYYWPGFHEPGSQLCMGMNKTWWSTVPEYDQKLIRLACLEENAVSMAEANAFNGEYLGKLIDEYGVELREFNDDVYEAFGSASAEVIEEARDHSPLAAEIFDSHLKARADIGAWTALSDAPYVAKRNRVLDM